jgi:hypothetical protein
MAAISISLQVEMDKVKKETGTSVLNKSNVLSNESNKSNQIRSNVGILRFIKLNLSHRFDLKNI